MAILWPSDNPSTIHGDAAPHPKQPYFLLSSRVRRLINLHRLVRSRSNRSCSGMRRGNGKTALLGRQGSGEGAMSKRESLIIAILCFSAMLALLWVLLNQNGAFK